VANALKSKLRRRIMGGAMLTTLLLAEMAGASTTACSRRLRLELTPDVPNVLDSGFLSSLLNNETSYQLDLLGSHPGSVIVVELTGPGPEYLCENVVAAMRKDGRVVSIHLERESPT
jgi:hypothetical protein